MDGTPRGVRRIRVGTSGWRYPSWRGDFYPRGLRQREELEYIGTHFSTVELNGSFYSPGELEEWADRCRGWAGGSSGRAVYVYLDNDAHGHAPHDARALAALVDDGPSAA